MSAPYKTVPVPERDRQRRKSRYVREHVLIAEAALGRPLPRSAVVHHVNEDPKDNRHANLVILERREHPRVHQRLHALRACGNARWLRCKFCGQYSPPEQMALTKLRGYPRGHHRECDAAWHRKAREAKARTIRPES